MKAAERRRYLCRIITPVRTMAFPMGTPGSNGKVTQDNVGSHKDLLASFPYLGPPLKARSAELVAG